MLRLNKDVLFLVIEELQNYRKTLQTCLLVGRTWCEITIPLLRKNPWKFVQSIVQGVYYYSFHMFQEII